MRDEFHPQGAKVTFALSAAHDNSLKGIMMNGQPTFMKTAATACLTCLILSGCAASADRYPSLAVRDAERVSGEFTPAASSTPAPAPSYTTDPDRISGAVEAAMNAHQQFEARGPATLSLVQEAGADLANEDARSRALVAMAGLRTLHGQTVGALANLDQLEIEAASVFAPVEDIRLAQSRIAQIVSEQDAVLAILAAEMK